MAKALSDKAIAIISYLRDHSDEILTADDIAVALGLTSRSVNGTITALAKKNLMERKEVENVKKKIIELTDDGFVIDLDAEKE